MLVFPMCTVVKNPRWQVCFSVVVACALAVQAHGTETVHRYFVKADDSLTQLEVKACFSDEFPDLTTAYKQLGLRVENGRISLDNEAELAGLRRAITDQTPIADDS